MGEVPTVGGLVLASIALAFALVQERQSREHAKRLAEANDKVDETLMRTEGVVAGLGEIAHALPTRVLGDWPEYLESLAAFVERADQKLVILCDHPAYGVFSNFAGSMRYQQAIENRLVAGVSVETIFLNPEHRVAIDDEFFPTEDDWTTDYTESIRRWVEDWNRFGSIELPATRRELIAALEQANIAAIERFQSAALLGGTHSGARCFSWRETSSLMPLYIWVRDGVEAVFAVAVRSDIANEIAFLTLDPALVVALEAAFERFANEAGACSRELTSSSI